MAIEGVGEVAVAGDAVTGRERHWVDVATVDELARARKLVVDHEGRAILVLWNEGRPLALDDECIHRQRSLSQGVLLNGRIVCPGHQWAFRLEDGYCEARDRSQPTHAVRVQAGMVQVSPSRVPRAEAGADG